MKLLVDAHCFDTAEHEGVNSYLKGLYGALPRLAPDIDFIFAGADTDRLRENFPSLPNTRFVAMEPQKRLSRILKGFPALIERLRPDYTHFQYVAPPGCHCRTIVTLHDLLFMDFPTLFPFFYRTLRAMTFRRTARAADILLTVSEFSRRRIWAQFGIPGERITLTPNTADEAYFNLKRKATSHPAITGGRPYLLTVARIEPRKNLGALVRIYADMELWRREIDLVMVGTVTIPDPDLREALDALAPEVRRHIHHAVTESQADLREWYAGARLFVFPSLAEGFGIPPLEAAAARIPVVCNRNTALADFDFFGANLVDFYDRDKVMARIAAELWDAPSTPAELEAIRTAVRTRYNWTASAANLLQRLNPHGVGGQGHHGCIRR